MLGYYDDFIIVTSEMSMKYNLITSYVAWPYPRALHIDLSKTCSQETEIMLGTGNLANYSMLKKTYIMEENVLPSHY